MTDLSTLVSTEEIVKSKDGLTATKYRVIEESIDLEALRNEKAMLEELLNMKEPTKEELIEIGKGQHPFYWNKEDTQKRLEQINFILGVK